MTKDSDAAPVPWPTLAEDLDELMRRTGLSYRDLARRTGRPRSTLHDALTGHRFPKLSTVLAVVRACDADEEEWRARWAASKRAQSQHVSKRPIPEEAITQLLHLLEIPPEQVDHALRCWAALGNPDRAESSSPSRRPLP